jgi:hypothetical protein
MYAAWLAHAERRLPIGALPFAEVKSVVVTGNGSAGVTLQRIAYVSMCVSAGRP